MISYCNIYIYVCHRSSMDSTGSNSGVFADCWLGYVPIIPDASMDPLSKTNFSFEAWKFRRVEGDEYNIRVLRKYFIVYTNTILYIYLYNA